MQPPIQPPDLYFSVFLFEVGKAQFYTKLSLADLEANIEYKEIFWVERESQRTFGPFPTIYAGMMHLTQLIAMEKKPTDNRPLAQVIHFDFRNKKRIQYG